MTDEDELSYLRKIEAAAIVWLHSLEGDGWSEEDIRSGICRPGMSELMQLLLARRHRLVPEPAANPSHGHLPNDGQAQQSLSLDAQK